MSYEENVSIIFKIEVLFTNKELMSVIDKLFANRFKVFLFKTLSQNFFVNS